VLLSLTVTQRRQVVVDISPELYLGQGRWRVKGNLKGTRFPNSFYGIGGDTPASAKETYTDRYGEFDLIVQRQVRPNLRVGPRLFVRGGSVTNPEDGGLIDREQVPGATKNWVVGVGGTMFWDTRDNRYYPTTGTYADLVLTVHSPVLGSDFAYGILESDFRAYRSLGFGVLAGQVLTQSVVGTAPFQILPKLGGSEQMRGYQSGRFRENVHWTTQVEYRVPLFWRFKATVFASIGEVGPQIGPELANGVERAVGVGGRLRLTDDGVHGRMDVAYSPTGIELYLSLGEAF
jgi:outer membrane protein assembly factor BamA